MIYEDGTRYLDMPAAEQQKLVAEYFALNESLAQTGRFLAANAVQPPETATTVRVRNGKVSATDGPFAETKEQFGGYYLIEASDLNDAIQVAARIPAARLGAVEVRPVQLFSKP